MTVKFTAEERAGWIKFCKDVAREYGITHGNFNDLTDEELDKEANWYFDLTGK